MQRTKKKQLFTAVPETCFWVNNGPVLANLRELKDALTQGISDEQYRYHAGNSGNDFSRWIADVLGDEACAKKLRRVKRRATAAKILTACLTPYK